MTTAFLDLETRKVRVDPPVDVGWKHPVTVRWQPFLIGLAFGNRAPETLESTKEDVYQNELQLWARLHLTLVEEEVTQIIYGADLRTMFDESICRGRLVNARRPLLPTTSADGAVHHWPHLQDPVRYGWLNLGPDPNPDGMSKFIPTMWKRNHPGQRDAVRQHCREDVVNLRQRARSLGVMW